MKKIMLILMVLGLTMIGTIATAEITVDFDEVGFSYEVVNSDINIDEYTDRKSVV